MKLKSLRKDLLEYLQEHHLYTKWEKASFLFEENFKHPSLRTELLEPHWRGIYSFRLDKKYRVLFFITGNQVEVFQITRHYKK
jgi:Txe/YoeB family toxin of Txe-Axe toxin-antitoxin module